jgi:signal transduction histidine kinase
VQAKKPHSIANWVVISVLFLILIGANAYLSIKTVGDLNELQAKIRDYDNNLMTLQNAHVSLLTAESGQRGFLLTEDLAYLEHYKGAIRKLNILLNASKEIVTQLDRQQQLISELVSAINLKIVELETTINQTKNDKVRQALRRIETDRGRLLYTQIFELFSQIKANEQTMRNEQIQQLQKLQSEFKRNNIISIITSLLLVCGILVLARINIKNNQKRQDEIEAQNLVLQAAVEERTKELSIFSEELSRSNRELEDFAFVASHDLQEPLRKIMAFGDRLSSQSDNLSDKQADYLVRMRGAASRMSTLISDLLEFSRVATRGKSFAQVDLNEVLANCIDDLNVLIEEAGAQIIMVEAPTLIADPTQMRQLFFNLLANGVKFSNKGDRPIVEIDIQQVAQPDSIEIEGLDEWYCIRIKDNGIGFEQEYAEKIFAPFQRLHSRESFKGTGIGLAICRRIVERHNGIIEAKGKVNEGAVFEVTLPAVNRLISIKQ